MPHPNVEILQGPLEIPSVHLETHHFAMYAIEAHLNSPSASLFVLANVPQCIHADRPLEAELATEGLGVGASAAASVAHWLSAYAQLELVIEVLGQPSVSHFALVYARP